MCQVCCSFSLCCPQLVLRDTGKVRLFKLGVAEDEYALVWSENYQSHVRTVLGPTQLCDKFLKVVLPGNQEVSISRQQLKEEMKLSEEEITYVVGMGGRGRRWEGGRWKGGRGRRREATLESTVKWEHLDNGHIVRHPVSI